MVKNIKENTNTEPKKVIRKKFTGVVISDKSDKTIVVNVERVKINKKRYVVSKKYKVHDEKNSSKIGDKVNFVECRPISKDKKWRIA